ncbi:MAG: hypothetical protein ACKPFD_19460 [Dolichospermum sp.]
MPAPQEFHHSTLYLIRAETAVSKNYAGLNLEAYVCTPEFYPRFNSSWIAFAKDFLEEYGFELFEINNKTCK